MIMLDFLRLDWFFFFRFRVSLNFVFFLQDMIQCYMQMSNIAQLFRCLHVYVVVIIFKIYV